MVVISLRIGGLILNYFKMDWIQGDKFIGLADFTFSPGDRHLDDYDKLPNTLDLSNLKPVNIVYTHTIYAKQLLELIASVQREFIIITHNSDVNIDESFRMPKNVLKWYSQNVNVVDPRIESIPIGLENNRWFQSEMKKEKMENRVLHPRIYKNTVYMNHNASTNPEKREFLYSLFGGESWVTSERGKNGRGFTEYLEDIYDHNFVICPEGNGMDTHRTWETLYMRSIPIEKRNINNQFYTDLPICFVDDWSEITLAFLGSEYKRIKNGVWNMKKLTFEYWRNKILRYGQE